MNPTPKIFLILLAATLVFHTALNHMIDNIQDFEAIALPQKTIKKISTHNPTIVVNAKAKDSWTLVDFSTGETQIVNENNGDNHIFKNKSWDLGFSRTKIITNGGATNPLGIVGVINLGPVNFESIYKAPQSGYIKDNLSFGNLTNKEFASWYNYRTRTHNIESKNNVYIVKTSDRNFMKMRILNYYCGKKDADCRAIMCSRQQAACLTVEYVLAENGTNNFPLNPLGSNLTHNNIPSSPIN